MLDHLEDVRSDLSVFHRIDDLEDMSAERFFSYVYRLPHYGGAIAYQVQKQQAEQQEEPQASSRHTFEEPPGGFVMPAREVPATAEALAADPMFAGLFSHSTAPLATS